MSLPSKELQCQYCNFKVISINSMYTHIHSDHKFIQTTASASSLSRPPAGNLPVYVPGNTHSREEYSCPGNAPPPPPFDKCGNPTYVNCSKVQQIMGLLPVYFFFLFNEENHIYPLAFSFVAIKQYCNSEAT